MDYILAIIPYQQHCCQGRPFRFTYLHSKWYWTHWGEVTRFQKQGLIKVANHTTGIYWYAVSLISTNLFRQCIWFPWSLRLKVTKTFTWQKACSCAMFVPLASGLTSQAGIHFWTKNVLYLFIISGQLPLFLCWPVRYIHTPGTKCSAQTIIVIQSSIPKIIFSVELICCLSTMTASFGLTMTNNDSWSLVKLNSLCWMLTSRATLLHCRVVVGRIRSHLSRPPPVDCFRTTIRTHVTSTNPYAILCPSLRFFNGLLKPNSMCPSQTPPYTKIRLQIAGKSTKMRREKWWFSNFPNLDVDVYQQRQSGACLGQKSLQGLD